VGPGGCNTKLCSGELSRKGLVVPRTGCPAAPESDETLGWKETVDGGVEVVFVEGDHESMFHDPNVDLLSRRLRQALQP